MVEKTRGSKGKSHTRYRHRTARRDSPRKQSASSGSSGPPPEQKNLGSAEQDQQIQPNGNVLDVEEIVGQLFLVVFNGGAVASVDLRPSRRARFDDPPLAIIGNPFYALPLLIGNK